MQAIHSTHHVGVLLVHSCGRYYTLLALIGTCLLQSGHAKWSLPPASLRSLNESLSATLPPTHHSLARPLASQGRGGPLRRGRAGRPLPPAAAQQATLCHPSTHLLPALPHPCRDVAAPCGEGVLDGPFRLRLLNKSHSAAHPPTCCPPFRTLQGCGGLLRRGRPGWPYLPAAAEQVCGRVWQRTGRRAGPAAAAHPRDPRARLQPVRKQGEGCVQCRWHVGSAGADTTHKPIALVPSVAWQFCCWLWKADG